MRGEGARPGCASWWRGTAADPRRWPGSSVASASTGSTIRSSSRSSRRRRSTSPPVRSSSSASCGAWPQRPCPPGRSSGSMPRRSPRCSIALNRPSATCRATRSPGAARTGQAAKSNGIRRLCSATLRSAPANDPLLDPYARMYIPLHDKTRDGHEGPALSPPTPPCPDDHHLARGSLAAGQVSRDRGAERFEGHRHPRHRGVPPDAAPGGRHLMARKNNKHDHGAASAMDRLIERSVEQALATWLSGQAVRATEQIGQELWADQEFRREFLETARAAAREALDRLRERRTR